MKHGFSLHLRPGCTHSERRFRFRVLEANELDVLSSCNFNGFLCLDVGANVGYWSRFLLERVGPLGSVHAFEPDPLSVVVLRRNLTDSRAHVVDSAVGAKPGTTILYSDPTQSGLNSTLPFHADRQYSIPMISIDEYVSRHKIDRVAFIKIDVQGGELAVLEGAERTLNRDTPCVYLEWTHSYDSTTGRVEYGVDHAARTSAIRTMMEQLGPIYRVVNGDFQLFETADWDTFEGNVIVNPPTDWLVGRDRRTQRA
jgi:FkbM family methyltransferase